MVLELMCGISARLSVTRFAHYLMKLIDKDKYHKNFHGVVFFCCGRLGTFNPVGVTGSLIGILYVLLGLQFLFLYLQEYQTTMHPFR